MTLEEKVTRGRATYISRIEYESQSQTLVVALVDDPEKSEMPNRTLTFSKVQSYSESAHEDVSEDYLESLLGLDERSIGSNLVAYLIATDAREVSFDSAEVPIIEDVVSSPTRFSPS